MKTRNKHTVITLLWCTALAANIYRAKEGAEHPSSGEFSRVLDSFFLPSFLPYIIYVCIYIFFHIHFGLFACGIGRSAIPDNSGSSRCMLQRSCEILYRYQTAFDFGTGERTLPSNQFILQPLYRPGALRFSGYILSFGRQKKNKQEKRVALGLRRGVNEIFTLLELYAAYVGL